MFWKSKTKDTLIQERPFRLTLPGKWDQEPSSDLTRWIYYSEDRREQLTVSFPLGSTHALSKDEQSQTLVRVVEMHRSVWTKLPGLTPVTMTETTFGESAGVLAARYGGIEPARHHRFSCLVLCSPWAVTVFLYEATGLSEAESDARARTIMNSIALPR